MKKNIFVFQVQVINADDCWVARNPKDVPIVPRTKFPANVYVLGV